MKLIFRTLILSLALPAWFASSASEVPAFQPHMSVFGTATAGFPNYGTDMNYGFTLGGYRQSTGLIGLETRGTFLRWGSQYHDYAATFGARIQPKTQRFAPYGVAAFGAGHTNYGNTRGTYGSATAPAWLWAAGMDIRVSRRVSWRVGEFSYQKISVLNGLDPKNFSSGLVIKLY